MYQDRASCSEEAEFALWLVSRTAHCRSSLLLMKSQLKPAPLSFPADVRCQPLALVAVDLQGALVYAELAASADDATLLPECSHMSCSGATVSNKSLDVTSFTFPTSE